jgi:hypothetical protein
VNVGSFNFDFFCKAVKWRHSTIYTEDKSDASLVEGQRLLLVDGCSIARDSRADEVTVWLREVIRKLHTHTHTGTHRKWGGFQTDKRWEGERENSFSAENLKRGSKKWPFDLVGERPPTLLMIMQDSIYSTSGAEATLPHWPTAKLRHFHPMS